VIPIFLPNDFCKTEILDIVEDDLSTKANLAKPVVNWGRPGMLKLDVELEQKKHRIEDAAQTTKAAVEDGILLRGGVTLIAAQEALEEFELNGNEATGRADHHAVP
jgi:hypothetical protein